MKTLHSHTETRRYALGLGTSGAVLLALVCGMVLAQEKKLETIKLIVDYNDGAQKVFPGLEWTDGMTVLDAMERAKEPSHGITFKYTGKGETAFLSQIDDLKNEGAGKQKKNWQYWVNGVYGDKSFGVWKLSAGDEILWKFDSYRGK